MAAIVDSYSESNYDNYSDLSAGARTQYGQSFTGDGGVLQSAKVYLQKINSPTGTVRAHIYAHSGTFGTSSVPTGSALATSGTIDVSTISTSFTLYTFTFTEANKITLTNGTKYVLVIEYSGGDATNKLQIGWDGSSPSHGGNFSAYDPPWGANNGIDLIFYVYSDVSSASSSISPSPSASVSLSPSASQSPSSSISPSPSLSISPSPSVSVSLSISPSPSVSVSLSPSATESPSPSLTPSSSISPSPSVSVSLSESPSPSVSVSLSPSPSPSVSVSSSISPSPSVSVSPSPSLSVSPSPSLSISQSPSLSESATPSPSPSVSASSSVSPSSSVSLSPSPSPSLSQSVTPSVSESRSQSPSRSPSVSRSASYSVSVSPSVSRSPSPSPSISPSPSPGQPYNLYTREAQDTLPSSRNDLATVYTTREERDVYSYDGTRVGLTGAASKYLLHQFKKRNNNRLDAIKVRVDLVSTLAPSSKNVYLQMWNGTTGSWETMATESEKRANEEFSLIASITTHQTVYYDFGNEVAVRVYQQNDAVGSQTLSVDLVQISFVSAYYDKYEDRNTVYSDVYSSRSITYTPKYPHKNPQDD